MADETKFVKAYCSKTKKYFLVEVKKFGSEWEIVNVDVLPDDEAELLASQVRQDSYKTHSTLIPCRCGNRKLGGCTCNATKYGSACSKNMKYDFACTYCTNFTVDYSLPDFDKVRARKGDVFEVQGKKIQVITFSNVSWKKFDNLQSHEDGRAAGYDEPTVHVIANDKNIEFHGYNISAMDEGVYYVIGKNDDFEMECDVDTSTIRPHPGGCLYISFGSITAELQLSGGNFLMDGATVATVGAKFNTLLSLTEGGKYQIYINGIKRAEKFVPVTSDTKVVFAFKHGSHHCNELSHAYLTNIKMSQGISQ